MGPASAHRHHQVAPRGRPSLRDRLSRLITVAALLPLVISACSASTEVGADVENPAQAITTRGLDAEEVSRLEETSPSYLGSGNRVLATDSGGVWVLDTSRQTGRQSGGDGAGSGGAGGSTASSTPSDDEETTVPTLTIICRDHDTGRMQWALTLEEAKAPEDHHDWTAPQRAVPELRKPAASGTGVVSPDGRHLSLLLRPWVPGEEDTTASAAARIPQQRTRIAVLEAATGRIVRVEEVTGLVLGQALTNGALAVQTAQDFFPGGRGKGTISVFPLDGDSAEATTIPSDKWLVGAGQDSLLLADFLFQARHDETNCGLGCQVTTVTRMSLGGQSLGTIDSAIKVYPGGWVERYTEAIEAADLAVREVPATLSEFEEIDTYWTDLAREVVDVDTGAAVSTTAMEVEARRLPTGPGLLVTRTDTSPDDSDDQRRRPIPVLWLSAADDGSPHTENLEAVAGNEED
ncbi:hypothetical protein [Actinomyces capricornis]|uniref:Uncharacterized protein n=1 Tax=Actinomyces capricornis TaxID=2755559 RepID=A0ABN6K7V2_9ACTO|nr:hypothetical protein [Actinomyces capricornis]BDA64692.1 hypothetical protein MANAM107_15260 [Actinomyces capricornis]